MVWINKQHLQKYIWQWFMQLQLSVCYGLESEVMQM